MDVATPELSGDFVKTVEIYFIVMPRLDAQFKAIDEQGSWPLDQLFRAHLAENPKSSDWLP